MRTKRPAGADKTRKRPRRKDLKEIFLGIKEASPIRENPTYPYGDYFVKYGGEDLDAFTERVYGAVKGIAEHAAGECILIVSHGMAIRRFLTKFPEKAGEITGFIGNCGILEMTYADGKLTVEKIIDPNAPYDGCDEPDDTGQNAKSGYRKGVG